MPNWCFNILTCVSLEDDDNILKKFNDENKEDEYLKYEDFTLSSDSIKYAFNSRWSPPCNRGENDWLENLSKKYPNIRFEIEWEEAGTDWWGEEHYINGEIVYDSYVELGDSYVEKLMRETDGNKAYNSIDLFSIYPNGFNHLDADYVGEGEVYDYLT